MAVKGINAGKLICDALGLDANKIGDIVIRLEPMSVGKIEITYCPDLEQIATIGAILRQFELVEKTDKPEVNDGH